jgi:hypothetical protein
MKEELFKNDAKQIVDMVFESKLFKDDVTRNDMNAIEDFISYLLQSRYDSYLKLKNILERVDKKTN